MLVQNPRQIKHSELLRMGRDAKGSISRLYLHWTAGNYGQAYDDYHLNIDRQGEIYCTCRSLTDLKAHTWRRNSGAVGIALCCAAGAVCGVNARPVYTASPPTELQLNQMAVIVAILCTALELPIDYEHVKTHYEAAIVDGYGPNGSDPDMRWDLSWLCDGTGSKTLRPGGEMLRQKARCYRQFFLDDRLLSPAEPRELSLELFS